jgi:hypothetical protein
MSANGRGPSARFGALPRTPGGCAPATPSEELQNLSQRRKNKEAWRRSFAPAFRLILRLEKCSIGNAIRNEFCPGRTGLNSIEAESFANARLIWIHCLFVPWTYRPFLALWGAVH